jgi:hypothetical protein
MCTTHYFDWKGSRKEMTSERQCVDLMLCGVQADVVQRLQFSWFINIFIEFFF